MSIEIPGPSFANVTRPEASVDGTASERVREAPYLQPGQGNLIGRLTERGFSESDIDEALYFDSRG